MDLGRLRGRLQRRPANDVRWIIHGHKSSYDLHFIVIVLQLVTSIGTTLVSSWAHGVRTSWRRRLREKGTWSASRWGRLLHRGRSLSLRLPGSWPRSRSSGATFPEHEGTGRKFSPRKLLVGKRLGELGRHRKRRERRRPASGKLEEALPDSRGKHLELGGFDPSRFLFMRGEIPPDKGRPSNFST